MVVVAALVVVLGTLAASAEAKGKAGHPTAGPLLGVNLSPNQAFIPGGESDADSQRELQGACRLGARLVRVGVTWWMLEPSRGQIDANYVSKLDSLMSQASACGISVMMRLRGTPPWDSSAPQGTQPNQVVAYPPRDGEFQWVVSWILRRWPGLQSLEVWNEPNFRGFWVGTPADYAALVNQAVAAKREVGSSTLILAGALASGAAAWLNQAYAAGMSGQDGISIHPYSWYCSGSCSLTDPSPAQAPFRAAITAIHWAMETHGDRGGLWLTEFGFATCPAQPSCVPEETQALWTAKSIRMASCYPYVRGMTAFSLRDIPGDPRFAEVMDAHFGLLRTDFSAKPSYSAVSSVFHQLGSAQAYAANAQRHRGKAAGKNRAIVPGSRACQRLLGRAEARRALR